MPYTMKYTTDRDDWGGAVKSGESFTIIQYTSAPNSHSLKEHLVKIGREVRTSSSMGGGGLDVGEISKSNNWTIERIK
jgi:hypothetical protein